MQYVGTGGIRLFFSRHMLKTLLLSMQLQGRKQVKREPIAHGSECRLCIFRKLLSLLEPLTAQHSSKYKNSLLYFFVPVPQK